MAHRLAEKGLNKLVNGDEILRRVLPPQFLLWRWIFYRKIVPHHPYTLDAFENSRGFDPFFVFCAHRFRWRGVSLAKYSVSGAEQRRAWRMDFGFFQKNAALEFVRLERREKYTGDGCVR